MTFWRGECYELGMKIIKVPVPTGHGKEQLNRLSEYLPELCLFQGPWLAGGAVRRMIIGEDISVADMDYFFNGYEDWQKACKKIERVADARLKTKQASTYRVPIGDDYQMVQFIKKSWPGGLMELLKSFDFRVCQFFTDGNVIVYPELALEDAKKKRLQVAYGGQLNTEALFARLAKYLKYGFRPDAKMVWTILTKVKRATRYDFKLMACPKLYSDVGTEVSDPTGLGPGWEQLTPKEKING